MNNKNTISAIVFTMLATTAQAYNYEVTCQFEEVSKSGQVYQSRGTGVIENVGSSSALFYSTAISTSNPNVTLLAQVQLGYEVKDVTQGKFVATFKSSRIPTTGNTAVVFVSDRTPANLTKTPHFPLQNLNGVSVTRIGTINEGRTNGGQIDTCYPTCINPPGGSGNYSGGEGSQIRPAGTIKANCRINRI